MAEIRGLTVRITGDASGLQSEIEKVENALQKALAAEGKVGNLEGQLSGLNSKLEATQQEAYDTETEINRLEKVLKAAFSEQDKIEDMQSELGKLQNQFQGCTNKAAELAPEIKETEQALKQAFKDEGNISKLESNIGNLQKKVEKLTFLGGEVATQMDKVGAAIQETAAKGEATDKLEEKYGRLQRRMQGLGGQANAARAEISQLQQELQGIFDSKADSGQLQSKLAGLKGEMQSTKDKSAELKTEIKTLQQAISESFKGKIDTEKKQAQMDKLAEKLQASREEASKLGEKIKKVNSELEDTRAKASGVDSLKTKIAGLKNELSKVKDETARIEKASKYAATALAGIGAAMASIGVKAVQEAGKFQLTEAAFTNLLGSAEKATSYIRELQDLAKKSPYTFEELTTGAQRFMAMGFAAEEVIPTLRAVGDAAAGVGLGAEGINRISLALGQIKAKGTVQAEEFRQLAEAGISAWDMLAKKMGVDVATAMKEVERRAVSANTGIEALVEGITTKYGGVMEQQAKTIQGSWAIATDGIQQSLAQLGIKIDEAFDISGTLRGFGQMLSEFAREVQDSGLQEALKNLIPPELAGAIAGLSVILTAMAIPAMINATIAVAGLATAAWAALGPFAPLVAMLSLLAGAFVAGLYKADDYAEGLTGIGLGARYASDEVEELNAALKRFRAENSNSDDWDRVSPDFNLYAGFEGTTQDKPKEKPSNTSHGNSTPAKKKLSEEERAIEALIKKYADASEQARLRGDVALQVAGLNASMLIGEAKQQEELNNKLAGFAAKHEAVIAGYEKELALAQKIQDTGTRQQAISEIEAQIKAQNELYNKQVEAANWAASYKNLQRESQSIMEQAMGDPNDLQAKIEENKKLLETFVAEVNAIEARGTGSYSADSIEGEQSGESQGFLLALLKKSPKALAEEFAEKQDQFETFADFIINKMAEATAAENENLNITKEWKKKQVDAIGTIGKSMGSALTEWVVGSKGIGEAMRDMVSNLLKEALKLFLEWQSVFYFIQAFSGPKKAAAAANKMVLGIGSGIDELATGGYISGAGTSTSDSIPAMLSNGEYVIRAAAVEKLGVPFLNGLNAGQIRLPRYADGGVVNYSGSSINFAKYGGGSVAAADMAAGGSAPVSVNLQVSAVDASGFESFLNRGGLDVIRQALYDTDRNFGTNAGVW